MQPHMNLQSGPTSVLLASSLGDSRWLTATGVRIYWIVILCVTLVYGALSCFLAERLRLRRLAQRERLPFDELYRQFLGDLRMTPEQVKQIWDEIGETLNVDPTLLRPTDRLGVELACKSFPLID